MLSVPSAQSVHRPLLDPRGHRGGHYSRYPQSGVEYGHRPARWVVRLRFASLFYVFRLLCLSAREETLKTDFIWYFGTCMWFLSKLDESRAWKVMVRSQVFLERGFPGRGCSFHLIINTKCVAGV